MKKATQLITGLILFSACQKINKSDTTQHQLVAKSLLSEKEWQIKSITTLPALIDVNGDGVKDSEIISSLQETQRDKILVFSTDGKVREKFISEGAEATEEIEVTNGTWSENVKGDSLTWKQEDGTLFNAKIAPITEKEVRLLYSKDKVQISYVFKQI